MPLKCIIVDDEPLAIEVLESYIDKMDSLHLTGKFRNAIKAFDFLQSGGEVDLIFLDIQMPKLTGIDFLKTLKNPPKVIFTTAYREYALEGFELEVVDYLLKPISFERFMKGVAKVMEADHEKPQINIATTQSDEPPFIFFNSDKKMIKVFLHDILWVESIKDYVKIVTKEKQITTHQKISYMENKLPESEFIRVHRSFIVHISKIDSYSATEIELAGNSVPIGRNYKTDVMDRLGSIVL